MLFVHAALHFASWSTVVTLHLVFMLSGNHTVNQKIQLCLSICVFHCSPKKFSMFTVVYIAYFVDLIYYRMSAHVSVNACLSFCECMH